MKQKQKKHSVFRTAIEITIMTLLVLTLIVNTIHINPVVTDDLRIQIDSPLETYTFNSSMNFSRIIIASTFVVFNDTGFNITATQPVDISIIDIDSDILGATYNELVIEFHTYSAGSITVNLSGMLPNLPYNVHKDNVSDSTPTANSTGMIIFETSSGYHNFKVYTIDDSISPTVTINFAGNLSDSGGPYWQPPGESTALTGVWSDGYYTNDSRQNESWIYINLTVEDHGGVDNVWMQWLNETTWTNYTYEFANMTGAYFEYNTSIRTEEGYNYSFNIIANDTIGNTKMVWWNKTGLTGTDVYTRRYVQLNCSLSNVSYKPYYIQNISREYGTDDAGKYDRLQHDQGLCSAANGFDSGYYNNESLTDTIQHVYCTGNFGLWFDESICTNSNSLNNIYYHVWWNATGASPTPNFKYGYKKTQTQIVGIPTGGWNSQNSDDNMRSSIDLITYGNPPYNSEKQYKLQTVLQTGISETYTDNDIYEYLLRFEKDGGGGYVGIVSNRSYNSFILLNVPSNATLNTSHADTDGDSLSDWIELYITYTNPFLNDTDNDSMDDYWENRNGSDPNNYTDYNFLPTQSGESPTNESTDIDLVPSLYVICTDANSDTMTATWRSNSSGDWVDFATNTSISTATNITQRNYNFSSASTTYWWSMNVTDGDNWTNATYNFTTSSGCGGVSTIQVEDDPLEIYAFEDSICLYIITVEDTYIIVNSTGFNITAPSNILVTLRHINESITNGTEGDELLEFEVYMVSGSTTISISGFSGNTLYNIYKDGSPNTSFNSNSTGCIEITVSGGVSYIYTIYRAGDNAPVISGEFPADGATGISVSGSPINIYASDVESNTMRTDIWTDMTGEWTQLAGWDVYFLDATNWSRRFLIDYGEPGWGFPDTSNYLTNEGWQNNGTRMFCEGLTGGNMSVTDDWAMTDYSTTYNWSVNCTDGTSWTNQTFSFTTEENTAPTISSPSPSNGATGVSIGLSSLSVTIADAEDTFNWTITTSPDIGSSNANGASNGVKTCSISGLSYDGYYTWTISVTDGVSWTNTTYDFTVESDPGGNGNGNGVNSAPTVSNPYPADESSRAYVTPICHVLVADANLDLIDVNFYWRNETDVYVVMQNNDSVSPGSIVYWNFINASSYDTTYYWRVTVYDGTDNITYSYSFTVYPDAPVISTYSPDDGSVNIDRGTAVTVTIFDYKGDSMNIIWRSNSSGSWVNFGYNGSVGNGTYSQSFVNATEYTTYYWWGVNINGSWTNATYMFQTEPNLAPVITDPIPRNGRQLVSIYTTNLSVVITDVNSLFNYTIETDPDIGSSSNNSESNGVKGCAVSSLDYSTTYTWYVNATDGESWTNASYTFTTKGSSDFDFPDFRDNLPEFAVGPFKVYVNDFIWVFIFIGMVGLVWGATKNVGSTLIAILLTFAAYGGKRAFVDGMGQQVSLLFSVIAAICLAVLILGLFLRKKHG